mgnify:CR=1 FL=1
MKLALESTTQIVEVNGVPCRVWEGEMGDGTVIHAFIARVAVPVDAPVHVHDTLEAELRECRVPSVVWPLRMIL